MYQSAALRIRPPFADPPFTKLPSPPAGPPGPLGVDPAAAAEAAAFEAAATIACKTAVAGETAGADGKAASVLTLVGLMFTVLARFGPELGAAVRGGGLVRAACAALLLGFAAGGLGAVVQAFRTISPRFRTERPSLAFFAEVARLDRDEYVARVEAMTMRDAVGQILAYNHAAATICAEKFAQLRRCTRCFEVAAGCWLLLALTLVYLSLRG
jgi:hypothetical protein